MGEERAQQRRRQGEPLPAALVAPHPARLPAGTPGRAVILDAHARAVAEGADGYVDPTTGMFSFTAAYHWGKGACCELGCRHCPWLEADERLEG